MNLFEKKMELSKMLQSDDGISSNELLEGINECIELAFKERMLENSSSKIKVRVVKYYSFYCPGCKHEHTYSIFSDNSQWVFNGNIENPSFTPSLLNTEKQLNEKTGNYDIEKSRCHLFITNGKIIYCGDCSHELSGKTIDIPTLCV